MTKAVQMSLAMSLMHSLITLCDDTMLIIKFFFIFFSLSSPIPSPALSELILITLASLFEPVATASGESAVFRQRRARETTSATEGRETEDARRGARLRTY